MFPNKRNENEMILANSDTNSSRPTPKLIGLLKLKNLPRCPFQPIAAAPRMFTNSTEMIPSTIVKFKSEDGARKSGMR